MSESAHRAARLLLQGSVKELCTDRRLANLTRDVEAFLQHAVDAPPVVMEAPHGDESTDTEEIQLNVVAGVLEPRKVPDNVVALGGVVLPTEENHRALDQLRAQEAQAMLNLVTALSATNTSAEADSLGVYRGEGVGDISSDEDDESVAVFDADDLDSDTTASDGEGSVCQQLPLRPPRIVELN